MELDLGGLETLESPTPDDVRHYLKYPPAESPFVVLSHETAFIQALYAGSDYLVEYSPDNGRNQYSCNVNYQTACELFLDFLAENTNYQTAVKWKRLTVWNTPGHPWALAIVCAFATLVFSGLLWLALSME